MMEWLSNLFGRKPAPASIARDRLKLVLMHDRVNCRPDLLDMMKNDIMKVLLKYMDIDEEELDIQVSQTTSETNEIVPVLFANIPIKNMRKQN
ncbi:MAG: cell division topological specificity factor MinE [Defluviitaleaceae bacterium]|nr:cell division topological specificity factor MinE [Defluviitaleaceae bacterium]